MTDNHISTVVTVEGEPMLRRTGHPDAPLMPVERLAEPEGDEE